jgi:hypothetical protein
VFAVAVDLFCLVAFNWLFDLLLYATVEGIHHASSDRSDAQSAYCVTNNGDRDEKRLLD